MIPLRVSQVTTRIGTEEGRVGTLQKGTIDLILLKLYQPTN